MGSITNKDSCAATSSCIGRGFLAARPLYRHWRDVFVSFASCYDRIDFLIGVLACAVDLDFSFGANQYPEEVFVWRIC